MRISSSQITNTKDTHFYVYADDYTEKARLGQAEECNGHANACAIYTRKWCCADNSAQFYDDELLLFFKPLVDRQIGKIMLAADKRKIVILPKIGQGCSQLNIKSPKCFAYLIEQLITLDPEYSQ